MKILRSFLLAAFIILLAGSPQPSSAAPAGGQPFTLDYPRLGMWWPDTDSQSAAQIARYDWVIYGDWNREAVQQIKLLNPQQVALNSTNACELSYDPEPGAPAWANEDVRQIPPEWFLTQVGSTLRADVDAVTTNLPVNALTATGGGRTYDLFIEGDTLLLDRESVRVTAVNTAAKTLTVKRGYVRRASPHSAGTRIAAHITFWPNSWLLNVSTLSPKGQATTSTGPETWAEYNARRAAALVNTAPAVWDGLLVDRSDPNESWLIENSTARTIDPDQSNTLLTDYSAFDSAWNAGLHNYLNDLRQSIGEDKIIFLNWGTPEYSLVNGNNFEGFPAEEGGVYGPDGWSAAVFGPWAEKGSYFEWLARARQPNLTMIETYEDDSGPEATGNGNYINPCVQSGFTPDYRKMRFGLTTALLNDGFFSYEINTNGHGSLCLMWFDEYDNAGAGRGYLGQPLGAPYRAISALNTPNLLPGGGFESDEDLARWDLWSETSEGYAASYWRDTTTAAEGNSSAKIMITQAGGTNWKINLSVEPTALTTGQDYTLSFWAKASAPRPVDAWVQQNSDPWTGWLDFAPFDLGTTWKYYEVSGIASGSAEPIFQIGMGQKTGTVWIDGVRLQQGSRDVWRRDFTGGVSLVNNSGQTQTVPLNGLYRKIKGSQAPAVNSGSLASSVTLPAHDGIILLRFPYSLHYQVHLPFVQR